MSPPPTVPPRRSRSRSLSPPKTHEVFSGQQQSDQVVAVEFYHNVVVVAPPQTRFLQEQDHVSAPLRSLPPSSPPPSPTPITSPPPSPPPSPSPPLSLPPYPYPSPPPSPTPFPSPPPSPPLPSSPPPPSPTIVRRKPWSTPKTPEVEIKCSKKDANLDVDQIHAPHQSVEQQHIAAPSPSPTSTLTTVTRQILLCPVPPPTSHEVPTVNWSSPSIFNDYHDEDPNEVPNVDWSSSPIFDDYPEEDPTEVLNVDWSFPPIPNEDPTEVSYVDLSSPPVFVDDDESNKGTTLKFEVSRFTALKVDERAGQKSVKFIVGFDFTKSNELRGARSFKGKSLHYIGAEQNPYEQAVASIGKTLAPFNEDNMIPCFGFGDALTSDQEVFSFYEDESVCCNGFEEVIKRYREVVTKLQLGGPKSFAPIIEMAMTVVEQRGGQYHVLVILTDGQVTTGDDTAPSQLSPQEGKTVEAIVKASAYALSIVVVGVGDGPWGMLKNFVHNLPQRALDNFRFVNAADIFSETMDSSRKEVEFDSAAFRELLTQYKAIEELGILGAIMKNAVGWIPLPPPQYASCSGASDRAPHVSVNHVFCPICLERERNMTFGCGHRTCRTCGHDESLLRCPICRTTITHKIDLF